MNTIRQHWAVWLALSAGFVAGYHALLLAAMVLRFGHLPNFIQVYDLIDAYRLTFSGTPSLRDALAIALAEPLLDIGYLSPQWKIVEWSLFLIPRQFMLVTLAGGLAATCFVVRRMACGARCAPARAVPALATVLGAGLAGIANATLFWVVCCASPTWIVALAMLGVSLSVTLALEPLGSLLSATGLLLLGWATFAELRRLTESETPPRVFLTAYRNA